MTFNTGRNPYDVPIDVPSVDGPEPAPGMRVDVAAAALIAYACACRPDTIVKTVFNGAPLWCMQTDSANAVVQRWHRYLKWQEGTEESVRRREEMEAVREKAVAERRWKIAIIMESMTPDKLADMVTAADYITQLCDLNTTDAPIDKAEVLARYRAAGYKAHDCVGDAYDPDNPEHPWRWLIGQAMACWHPNLRGRFLSM